MIKKLIIIFFGVVIGFWPVVTVAEEAVVDKKVVSKSEVSQEKTIPNEYLAVGVLDLVNNPDNYLAKKIKFVGEFNAFSILGLNYKPAFRDSKDYIGILLRKPVEDPAVEIPLAELKIFVHRKVAEKFTKIEKGDQLEISGNVFSKALGDPWVEAENVNITAKIRPGEEGKKTGEALKKN